MSRKPRKAKPTLGSVGGRPRHSESAELARADEVIARSVHVLDGWGFRLRPRLDEVPPSGALECVAVAARNRLHRADAAGIPLSHSRVEAIYRAWFKAEMVKWRRNTEAAEPDPRISVFPPSDWSRYTRASRVAALPSEFDACSLLEIADRIVLGGGVWVETRITDPRDFTDRFAQRLSRGPMTRTMRLALAYELRMRKRRRP